MKKLINLLAIGLLTPLLSAQTIVFQKTFDTVEDNDTVVPGGDTWTDAGWTIHHSFAGKNLNVLYQDPLMPGLYGQEGYIWGDLGDPNAGSAYGYVMTTVWNWGEVSYGKDFPEPGPHPVTGLSYDNRVLAHFGWASATITEATRSNLAEFRWFQGMRHAGWQSYQPAVRIDGIWYVYRMTQDFLNANVRERGEAETVFQNDQMIGTAYYNAQTYTVPWTEDGWTELIFDGTETTDSTVGMTLSTLGTVTLPAGDITAVGLFAEEALASPAYGNHRYDSFTILAASEAPAPPPVSINHDATQWIVSVPSVTGYSYQARTSTDLAADPSTWTAAGDPQSGTDGVTLEFHLPKTSWTAAPTRFFVVEQTAE
ncbi:MAG: hypothetical protein ACP5I4_10240 [Oceanipulchritudo sp.]